MLFSSLGLLTLSPLTSSLSTVALPLVAQPAATAYFLGLPVDFVFCHGAEVALAGLAGAWIAQLFKFISALLIERQMNFRLLFETGGMPSSHTGSMTAMATSVGLIEGFNSVLFAVALAITLVVMYDAAGVRRAAGRMAGILNQITDDLYSHHPKRVPVRLRELLGHTPFEVLVGALLGIALACGLHQYLEALMRQGLVPLVG
ncbi:MAG: divergent PAP2 family protein [Candidatus Melainabacteria bacterium]|jgi:acid phosphatase family membrane protein YuiD|nr:divergent PAP2 family protein [Candidatus Melainabacteria bacterium]